MQKVTQLTLNLEIVFAPLCNVSNILREVLPLLFLCLLLLLLVVMRLRLVVVSAHCCPRPCPVPYRPVLSHPILVCWCELAEPAIKFKVEMLVICKNVLINHFDAHRQCRDRRRRRRVTYWEDVAMMFGALLHRGAGWVSVQRCYAAS